MYKVKGLRPTGCLLSETRREKEKQGGEGNCLPSYSNNRQEGKTSPWNGAWKHNSSFSQKPCQSIILNNRDESEATRDLGFKKKNLKSTFKYASLGVDVGYGQSIIQTLCVELSDKTLVYKTNLLLLFPDRVMIGLLFVHLDLFPGP